MDTIAAIATPSGNGGIAIIKISGSKSFEIIDQIFSKKISEEQSHTIHYGNILKDGEFIDEVLVSIFRAPKSYTKEDLIEINCHGGIIVTKVILSLILEKGARMATPGEFTKRAFLNGRIDLTQAEAAMDLIASQNELHLKYSSNALRGDIYEMIEKFRDELAECIMAIEVNLDFPEYENENELTLIKLQPVLFDLEIKLRDLLSKSKGAKILNEGITTAIVGRPNVGKSSLLNALLREDKAIVSDIPGTTRDIVEGRINLGGIILNLIDTAGIRDSKDTLENKGILKSRMIMDKADIIIYVLDKSMKLDENDKEILELTKNKTRIVIMNKDDLDEVCDYEGEVLRISLFEKEDIKKLEDKILEVLELNRINDKLLVTNTRQINAIREAHEELIEALNSCRLFYPVDIININIREAWKKLGEVTGSTSNDTMLKDLFAKFCIGK